MTGASPPPEGCAGEVLAHQNTDENPRASANVEGSPRDCKSPRGQLAGTIGHKQCCAASSVPPSSTTRSPHLEEFARNKTLYSWTKVGFDYLKAHCPYDSVGGVPVVDAEPGTELTREDKEQVHRLDCLDKGHIVEVKKFKAVIGGELVRGPASTGKFLKVVSIGETIVYSVLSQINMISKEDDASWCTTSSPGPDYNLDDVLAAIAEHERKIALLARRST